MLHIPVPIVLASASPVRRELLGRIVGKFKVMPAHIEEKHLGESDPAELTVRLAREKASAVAQECTSALIVAADTLAWCDGEFIGKPADRADAVIPKMIDSIKEVRSADDDSRDT